MTFWARVLVATADAVDHYFDETLWRYSELGVVLPVALHTLEDLLAIAQVAGAPQKTVITVTWFDASKDRSRQGSGSRAKKWDDFFVLFCQDRDQAIGRKQPTSEILGIASSAELPSIVRFCTVQLLLVNLG